jgi:3-methyladenine DNA glycosylase AlkC
MTEEPQPSQLKDWFDEKRYRHLANRLAQITPDFQKKTFLDLTLNGLESRSLMQRLHQCAIATEAALPGTYRDKLQVLHKLAHQIEHNFVAIFLSDFVATYGQDDFDTSLQALRSFTRYGSAEFAIRSFIAANPARSLKHMQAWTADPDEHVRRLASEGARPRLPWGLKLKPLVKDPEPCGPILEALKADPSLYVRRSVANHLNDITKDHPDWVLNRLEQWDLRQEPLRWIARHACRTLIKRGDPRALQLLGFGNQASLKAKFSVSPARVILGQAIQIEASLTSTAEKAQSLVVDYVVHYVKARGDAFQKVFKWTEIELPPKTSLTLSKKQTLRDFTTRRHHAGHHAVELQVNGVRVAQSGFILELG